jgi:predicted nucleic acid-binding protein
MIMADSGFWVALLNRRDARHPKVRRFAAQLNEPLVTTVPVVTEVCYLLQQRRGPQLAAEFLLAQQDGLFSLFPMDEQHLPRCAGLMRQYENLPMDFADASLVILAEHLGHGRIVSTDQRDFHAYRWKNQQPFQNLLDAQCLS